jgi:hypothetical protein
MVLEEFRVPLLFSPLAQLAAMAHLLFCHILLAEDDAIEVWHNENRELDMKNFHLPLPEQTWSGLRAEAARAQVPATALAREAIDSWLRERAKKARHDQIAGWAAEMAGTHLDLDPELEAAGIERLVHAGKPKKGKPGK